MQLLGPASKRAFFALPTQTMQVWSTKGVEGVHRFLARVYRLVTEQPLSDAPPSADQLRLLHQTIKKVGCVELSVPSLVPDANRLVSHTPLAHPVASHTCPLLACGTAIAHRSRRPDTAPPAVCPPALLPACHLQVTEETEEMRFHTALAAMMEFVNGGAPSFTTI